MSHNINIVHCVSCIVRIFFHSFVSESSFMFKSCAECFSLSSSLLYSFVGYNLNCGTSHVTESDINTADWIHLVTPRGVLC